MLMPRWRASSPISCCSINLSTASWRILMVLSIAGALAPYICCTAWRHLGGRAIDLIAKYLPAINGRDGMDGVEQSTATETPKRHDKRQEGERDLHLPRVLVTADSFQHCRVIILDPLFRAQLRPVTCLPRPTSVSVSRRGSGTAQENLCAREFFNIWAASGVVSGRVLVTASRPETGRQGAKCGPEFDFRLVLQRSRDRPRHRQHAHLR